MIFPLFPSPKSYSEKNSFGTALSTPDSKKMGEGKEDLCGVAHRNFLLASLSDSQFYPLQIKM